MEIQYVSRSPISQEDHLARSTWQGEELPMLGCEDDLRGSQRIVPSRERSWLDGGGEKIASLSTRLEVNHRDVKKRENAGPIYAIA